MGRPLARVSVCVAAGAVLVIGCQLVAGLDNPLPAPASDASTGVDGTLPDGAQGVDAADGYTGADTSPPPGDASTFDAGTDSGCPATTQGPDLVNVGPFCIDSTEVTNAQYNVFVSANAPLSLQPAPCAFNGTYVPYANWPYAAGNDDYPVADVNWCQAYAFCAWAGKHLCGAIDGGPADHGNFTAFDNAHYYACSMNGAQNWPYGTTYAQGSCDDAYYADPDAGGSTVEVATLGNCEGSYANLWDMVGNVEEWQDSCDGVTGANDRCFDGTGSFGFPTVDSGITPGCNFEDGDLRSDYDDELGFRCCSP